jgi:hypothetical protein
MADWQLLEEFMSAALDAVKRPERQIVKANGVNYRLWPRL